MRTTFLAMAATLAIATDAAGAPRQQAPRDPKADLRPVTLVVLDRASRAPIGEFDYQFFYEAPGLKGPANREAWIPVRSPAGTVEIQAPGSCRLVVRVRSPDYIRDPFEQEALIRSADRPRRVEFALRRGITLRGTVRDARTRAPIAGATVTPHRERFNLMPDEDKQVKTGIDGRYEIRGVDPELGVEVDHPDYVRGGHVREGKITGAVHDILVEPGRVVEMTVVDTEGKPLEGASVVGLTGAPATSGKDGRLVVRRLGFFLSLTIHRDGYIDRELREEDVDSPSRPGGTVVVLEPALPLKGRVVGPDGRPVESFAVAAGPGRLPPESDCVRRKVRDRDGRFTLGLSKEGTWWVGVAADGFAGWEGWIEFRRDGRPMEIRLEPGAAVTARIGVPEALRKHVEARLVPRREPSRDETSVPFHPLAAELFAREAAPAADGILRFEHLRADRYRLTLIGKSIPTTEQMLDVPAAGMDIGTIPLGVTTPMARGRVAGRIWHPEGEPWAFARGYVAGLRRDQTADPDGPWKFWFVADEDGRFAVDGVPVGEAVVGVPEAFFDVIETHSWRIVVAEGQTTRVHGFEPDAHRRFTLDFAIGDGSKAQYESGTGLGAARKVDNMTTREPMFRVELVPLSKGPLSFAEPDWVQLDAAQAIVLPDVGPGTYRLRLYDWLGRTDLDSGPLFDGEVIVPAGGNGKVRIPLGGGCITGKVPAPRRNFDRPIEATAVPREGHGPPRRARCDDDGNFCVRYITPGRYTLFVHDPEAGYCRIDDVNVPAGVVDVAARTFVRGAAIRGEIRFARPTRVPTAVVATDASGATVRQEFPSWSSCDRIELMGLWPGRWTVSALGGDEVLASGQVAVSASGTVSLTLTAGAGASSGEGR